VSTLYCHGRVTVIKDCSVWRCYGRLVATFIPCIHWMAAVSCTCIIFCFYFPRRWSDGIGFLVPGTQPHHNDNDSSLHGSFRPVLPRFCDDHAGDLSPSFPFPTFLLLPSPSAFPFLPPLPPFPPLLTPVLRFLSLPLEVEPLKSSRGSRERCFWSAVTELLSGVWAEPQPKSNLVHFSLKL